jgi:antitoxin component YwqK of YwqJK toxin-antitoxin module
MVRATKSLSTLTIGLALACAASSLEAAGPEKSGTPTPAKVEGAPQTVDYVVELPAEEEAADSEMADREAADDSAPEEYSPDEDTAQPLDDLTPEPLDETATEETEDTTESKPATESSEGDAEEAAEVIKDRYPNGSVRIERQVTQDAQGNYLNHGTWKNWDERGNLIAQGQYEYGNRTGVWIRWYRSVQDANILAKLPYSQFVGPFISQATFKNDQLDGLWTIYDGKTHKISQWSFVAGKRQGPSTWWYANGKKMREANFQNGDMDGEYLEWAPDATLRVKETFESGRKLAVKTSYYNGGKVKKSEGMYLFAKDVEHSPDDWWNCKLVTTVKTGKDEKHGAWTAWFQSGQPQLEGNYENDLQVGQFTWWHSNGQRALQGEFARGKQVGKWTWWHANGQKKIEGEYANGNPSGRWTWWKEDGRVVQSADLSNSEGVVIETPRQLDVPAAPIAPAPNANTAPPGTAGPRLGKPPQRQPIQR